MYQYKSNMTCMRWIMPQTICIWLIMTMWWDNKEKYRHYVALMLPAMLYTLAVVRAMFTKYADYFDKEETDDSEL